MSEEKRLVPYRRFKGFTDDWEQRKLGEVVTINSGKDYKHLNSGLIPVYGTGGYMLSVDKALSQYQDAIGIGRKGTIDKPYILKAPFWTVDTLFFVIPRDFNDLYFIYGIFQYINWKNKDESTGLPSLSKVAIIDSKISFTNLTEQREISRIFKRLDKVITLHQRKLDKLKDLKKSYLSKMFPAEGQREPELRFKGFTGDWEQRKLGDISKSFRKKTTSENEFPILSSTMSGIYFQNVYFNQEVSTISNIGYNILPREYITYRSMSDTGEFRFNIQNLIEFGIVSPAYPVFTIDNFIGDNKFITLIMNNNPFFIKQILSIKVGGTRYALSYEKLMKLFVQIPTIIEQKKVTKLIERLEVIITLHQRKLDKLKDLKKSYLSKMFPAEGQREPELRFKGFTGDWEQRKLSKVASYRRGSFPQPYGKAEWYGGEGSKPFVQVVDVSDNLKLENKTKQRISRKAQSMSVFTPKGSIVVTLQGSIGRVAITQYDSYCDRTLLIIKPNEVIYSYEYFAIILKLIFNIEKNKAPGGTIKTITKEALSEFIIKYPYKTEQIKIGKIFTTIDTLITLHQRKLDKLKNLKKAYLNEMFV